MASIFSPPGGAGDPVLQICHGNNDTDRLVYCNKILSSQERLQTSWQWGTLIVGIAGLALPVLLSVILTIYHRLCQSISDSYTKRKRKSPPGRKQAGSPPSRPEFKIPSSTKAFQFLDGGVSSGAAVPQPLVGGTVYISPLPSCTDPTPFQPLQATPTQDITCLGLVDAKDVSPADVAAWETHISDFILSDDVSGVVLKVTDLAKEDEETAARLFARLRQRAVPIVLNLGLDEEKEEEESEFVNSVDFSSLVGIIVENACILPNGERRDYFRSEKLRELMNKCAKERLERPHFFVAFHDLWDQQPSVAVVCRGEKVASHFEAIYQHGPRHVASGLKMTQPPVSGFEYLRKPETSEQKKKVYVGDDNELLDQTSRLDVDRIASIVPGVKKLLQPVAQTTEKQEWWSDEPELSFPPPYREVAPARDEFWECDHRGEALSALGCIPLTASATDMQYEAILATQTHLRDLNMLQRLRPAEVDKLVMAYRNFQLETAHPHLFAPLVEGLVEGKVCVYKGLDTGFKVPDGEAHFWGISVPRSEDGDVDIFISRSNPSDVATILHVWLAHSGVSRVERYEEELRLENNMGSDLPLPTSIQTAINMCSPSEVLFFLQQLQVSRLTHPFRIVMEAYCRAVLLDESSTIAWNDAHCRLYLEGKVSMRNLLERRLAEFARQGATALPSADGLVAVAEKIEQRVRESLYSGNVDALNAIRNPLTYALDPMNQYHDNKFVDVNTDLIALMFFTTVRKLALEDVYLEATDHCPLFSQADQAAVFAELWVLGSQCEAFFGMHPRALGKIIYDQYTAYLRKNPPPTPSDDGDRNGHMTVYSKPKPSQREPGDEYEDPARRGFRDRMKLSYFREKLADFGALSIFCMPAIMDILLLTFVGRGLFMTAYMGEDNLLAACYGLLIALLISAGVTGWVGSIGNYYLCNFAYTNMVFFHAQRLSGGFVLTLLVGLVGFIAFTVKTSVYAGLVFFAYLVLLATYLNILGIMATMHQEGSPLTSGRSVLWRTIPLLLISPALSSFVNGKDLAIYLSVGYGFLALLIFQYRKLCHEWMGWLSNIPKFTEADVHAWYEHRMSQSSIASPSSEKTNADETKKLALQAFRDAVKKQQGRIFGAAPDALVHRVVEGLPYINWILRMDGPPEEVVDVFSPPWFAQLSEAQKKRLQMSQGLKEHSVFFLFRQARYDIGQNVGLFLVCLLDRWVSIVMSGSGNANVFSNFTSRYAICFAILYFCLSIMVLDVTIKKYWQFSYDLPKGILSSDAELFALRQKWQQTRRIKYFGALLTLASRLLATFGLTTILVWLFVKETQILALYYLYCLGYTGVMIFQFNRCFTTSVRAHVLSILTSAVIGFIVGCLLYLMPEGKIVSVDVIGLCVASVFAAVSTSYWAIRKPKQMDLKEDGANGDKPNTWKQHKIGHSDNSFTGKKPAQVKDLPGDLLLAKQETPLARSVSETLRDGQSNFPGGNSGTVSWREDVLNAALAMWLDEKIRVTVCPRGVFLDAGLSECVSFSELKDDELHITTGFLPEEEVHLATWQPLLACMIGEAILYHTARGIIGLDTAKAVQAEHILSGADRSFTVSKRIAFQLATEDRQGLYRIREQTNQELMKHLCLETNIDSEWVSLPRPVQETILSRIQGMSASQSRDFPAWMEEKGVDLRCSNFHVKLCLELYLMAGERVMMYNSAFNNTSTSTLCYLPEPDSESSTQETSPLLENGKKSKHMHWTHKILFYVPINFVKWVAIISGAGSNIERELWYSLRKMPRARKVLMWLILAIWQMCFRIRDTWIFMILIFHHKSLVQIWRLARKGTPRTLYKNRIVVVMRRQALTGFAKLNEYGKLMLNIYEGHLKEVPEEEKTQPVATAVYDHTYRLITKSVKKGKEEVLSSFTYGEGNKSRRPTEKYVVEGTTVKRCHYDERRRISHGIIKFGDVEYSFRYFYKSSPKGSQDVLKAEYELKADHPFVLTVYWGTPPKEKVEECNWTPSDRVGQVDRSTYGRTFTTVITYPHRRDPVETTYMEENGRQITVDRPPRIFEHEDVLLQRPTDVSFENDDLFIYHRRSYVERMAKNLKQTHSFASRLNPMSWFSMRKKSIYRPVPTWWLRTELWDIWRKSGTLDAVTACWMDELILREEPLLHRYWSARNSGQLSQARMILDADIDQISAAIEIEKHVGELCMLPIKTADLYAMGLGKDANQITTRPQDCFNDSENRISVIFNDIGCWPESPGGVSNCRRDLVNGHTTIRNHVLAESANEYGIPRFQVERNVQSLKVVPLWGLDGRVPNHGLIENLLEMQVEDKIVRTDIDRDVVDTFIPLLRLFVKGARSRHISKADMYRYSNAILDMFQYFEHKDYNKTWNSKEVAAAWAEAWLIKYDDPDITDPEDNLAVQQPTMSDFRDSLAIFSSYFFIYAVQTPEDCPRVFQSTHHGISSMFGVFLKYQRGATFGIWDHAILWRECCLNLSPAQSTLPIPVQSMVLAGIGLAMKLAYFHADVILPCTSFFNPIWETSLGTDTNRIGHEKKFARKIDPIVNGVSNMDAFKPVDEVRTTTPTVVMLSNVQFIKDIRTAIRAADVIVNQYGFKEYRLFIYGAKDREPEYAINMTKLIEGCKLTEHVILKGFGKPQEILKDAWLFMNSSLSEGLPLAVGEAALAGVPVVATAVGATALVLTDPDNPSVAYGEVVPPNDPVGLARAQISMLAMAGPWAKFAGDVDKRGSVLPSLMLPDTLTPTDVAFLTKRMHEKTDARRKLGMLTREVVLKGFHGERYLREHEQMYWVQWHMAKMRRDPGVMRRRALVRRSGLMRFSGQGTTTQTGDYDGDASTVIYGGSEAALDDEYREDRNSRRSRSSYQGQRQGRRLSKPQPQQNVRNLSRLTVATVGGGSEAGPSGLSSGRASMVREKEEQKG
uniref:Uncharacterized protein B19A17.110 n=1 Tax=Neurospora crassa TaxID=5141 RepID=Q872P1_NEUCS|nr:hypothetical protein [Neurospora crassa]